MPIGAGAKVYMGTPANPNPDWNSLDQAALDAFNINDKINSFNVNTTQGTVDITKLNVNEHDWFRRHIAGLNDADGSMNYGEEDPSGAFIIRVANLMQGSNHPKGRGKVGTLVRPYGDGSGKLQYKGDVSFPSLGQNTEIESEIGGDLQMKFDGKIAYEQQP